MTNQEAIEAIKMAQTQVEWDYPMDYAAAFDKAIEALEQEPKRGHWECIRANVICSNCHKGYKEAFGRTSATTYNYCPNCGSFNGGEE